MARIRICFVVLTLVLSLNLLGSVLRTSPAVATPDEVKWSKVSIPTEGKAGNWVLANGSSIQHLTMAIDGTLYCYANPSATSYRLFKSTDGGGSWSYAGGVEDAIVAIVTAPSDASVVYYATTSNVYKSIDAGNSFTPLPANPGGAGSNNLEITAIDVTQLDVQNIIAVGIRDTDSSEYGGVYTLDENQPSPSWTNTDIGSYDVYCVAFSPKFPADQQLVAIATDETDTVVTSKIGDADWGETIGDATIGGLEPISAAIAFPSDYDINTAGSVLFTGIDTGSGNGDVYQIITVWAPGNSVTTDLDIGSAYALSSVDVTTLAVSGNTAAANLLAGITSSAQIYISTDGGINWTRSTKEPTGQSETYLLMAPDFTSQGRAYATTSGTESALSYTRDGGVTWNQVSLIDTGISTIIDLAVSPNYRQDNTLFMLTFNGEHSLWRSLNGGTTWERTFSSTLPNVDSLKLVELSPEYGNSSQVVFLAGVSSGNPAIWKSTDNGQTFTSRSAPLTIDTWAVFNDDSLFIGSYDGSNGLVYRTTDSGATYSTGAAAGDQSLNSIALSATYQEDKTILAGNTTGQVYWSNDNGTSFEPLGQQLPLYTGAGKVTVAFDPGFISNKTVYAASDAKVTTSSQKRIYRFIIGKSDTWKSIDSTLPESATIRQLVISSEGTLYATNSQPVDGAKEEGGIERSLSPRYPLSVTFETVMRGLDDGVTLSGLWSGNNQLWAIDANNTRLMTYYDTLIGQVILATPANQAPGIDTRGVILDWAPSRGATEYQWQLNDEPNFSTVPEGFKGDTQASSVRLSVLEPATRYYWRVRATKPVLSPWSARRSFTTILGGSGVGPELLSPEAGADEVPLKPVLQWNVIAGADSYELLVSAELTFTNPLIAKSGASALPTTAWQSDISLDYDTTYYWKVRGSSSDSYSVWSAVGAFITESPPVASSPPPKVSAPPEASASELPLIEIPAIEIPAIVIPPIEIPPIEIPPVQLTVPNWAIYSGITLLATMVLLLIVLLVLVVSAVRRS